MVQKLSVALLTVAFAAANIQARNIRLYNACPFTVWGAHQTGGDPNSPDYNSRPKPSGPTGYELASYDHYDIPAPDNWNSGRIWARTECDFSKPDTQSCATGSCIGGFQCDGNTGGIPPVTVAEFTLIPGGQDNYDVSNVDGSNLPMTINPSDTSCAVASCPVDLNANCPGELQLKDSAGNVVGCKSACLAKGGDSNCCTGSHNTAATCPQSGVEYYDYFHNNCPNAYAYAYDEHNGVLKTCGSSPDYTITLCPPPS